MLYIIDILVVSADEHLDKLSRFLLDYVPINDKVKIELVTLPSENITGSADYLRAISNKIHSDFIVVSSDMVTEVNFAAITQVHRLKATDLTVLLTPYQGDDDSSGDSKGIVCIYSVYNGCMC